MCFSPDVGAGTDARALALGYGLGCICGRIQRKAQEQTMAGRLRSIASILK